MMCLNAIRTAVSRRLMGLVKPTAAAAPDGAPLPDVALSETSGLRVAWKQQALDDLARWLDALPDEEPADDRDPALSDPADADLLALIGETTALRQEVRLMGRGTGKLLKTIEQVAQEVTTTVLPLADEIKRLDREARAAETRNLLRPLLLDMGDLLEALREARGRMTEPELPWYVPARVRTRVGAQPTRDVLDLLIRRVESILQRHDVKPIASLNAPFDVACMTADGVSRDGMFAAGHVSAVVRQGFVLAGAVLRPAHVIVEQEEPLS